MIPCQVLIMLYINKLIIFRNNYWNTIELEIRVHKHIHTCTKTCEQCLEWDGHCHPLSLSFIGSVCRQSLCINFSVPRVNFLATLRSHLDVCAIFGPVYLMWMLIIVIYLGFYCSGYLKCIEKGLVNYTYFDNCWLNFWVINE